MQKWEYLKLTRGGEFITAGGRKLQLVAETIKRGLPDRNVEIMKEGLQIKKFFAPNDVVYVLDVLGAEGWELVGHPSDETLYLKRPIER